MKKFLLAAALGAVSIANPASAEEKTYQLDQIHSVDAGGAFNIVIDFGKKQSVTVSEEQGRFDHIDLEVEDGTLDIDFRKNWRGNGGPEFTINLVLTSLKELDISGASRVLVRKAKLDDLEIDASGASQFVLSGTCNHLAADVSGAVKFVADELHCKSIEMELSGASEASIWADEKVDVETSGVSKIAVHGDAKSIHHESSGLSNMVHVKG
ncbi:MAG: DUF2807 domain-containing protein [Sphingomonadales bacterium]|jgi:hypothetical protein